MQHKLNPVQCIWYLFEKRKVGEPPQPNQLMQFKYVARFRTLDRLVRDDIITSFSMEKQRFKVHLHRSTIEYGPGKQAWMSALVSDEHGCSPLFRYCIAVSEDLKYVIGLYETSAMMQYMSAPDVYDEVWGEWIPDELKELATWR